MSRLKAALEKQPKSTRDVFGKLPVGQQVRGSTPTSSAALHVAVGQVKSQAKNLDEVSASAFQALNASFKLTYESVANMKSTG